jgi:hypothetical protein
MKKNARQLVKELDRQTNNTAKSWRNRSKTNGQKHKILSKNETLWKTKKLLNRQGQR